MLSAEAAAAAILSCVHTALDTDFRRSLEGVSNPYGDGRAAERIAAQLAAVPLGEELLIKR